MTMTMTKKTGGPRVGEGRNISKHKFVGASESLEWGSGPQKRGREEAGDKNGEEVKCWNCTRRKVECIWPR